MPYKPSVVAVTQGLAALGMNYALKRGLKSRGAPKTQTKTARKGRRYTKSRAATGSRTITRRRRKVTQHTSTENRAISLQVGARKPSAFKLAMACMEPQYYRTSGLTQYDTNYGYYPLAQRTNASGWIGLPLHFWDITACGNNVNGVITRPVAGQGTYFTNGTSTASAATYALPNQAPDGTANAGGEWYEENTSVNWAQPMRKAFHEWTHIKANLFGVRKRATRFKVDLVMIKDTLADFINGTSTNVQKQKLYDYLSRPFMFNNLNMGDPMTAQDIKFLKSYEVTVDPITTDEYNGVTSVPKIQTLNWFIRHNRVRRYDWRRDDVPGVGANPNAAWDAEDESGQDLRVDPKYRVYLIIRALSPERRTVSSITNDLPDPISEPSYDLVIRNKFLFPV